MISWTWELTGNGLQKLKLRPREIGPVTGRDVLLRVDCVGLCGSDVKVASLGNAYHRLSGRNLSAHPVVLGHEVAATVVEAGSRAPIAFKVGTRVAISPHVTDIGPTVGYGLDGGYRQYMRFTPKLQRLLIRVPRRWSSAMAALIEPWACVDAAHRQMEQQLAREDIAWVVGAGGALGQMHWDRLVLEARSQTSVGERRVVLFEGETARRRVLAKRVQSLGQSGWVSVLPLSALLPRSSQAPSLVRQGADRIVVCTSRSDLIAAALRHARRRATVLLFSSARESSLLDWSPIHDKRLVVTGSAGASYAETIAALERRRRLRVGPHIAAVVGLNHVVEALRAVRDRAFAGRVVSFPHLRFLPLTALGDLHRLIRLPERCAREVSKGVWSRTTEGQLAREFSD